MMFLTLTALFSLIPCAKGETPLVFCAQYSNTDCGNCINNVKDTNFSCGYCAVTKTCEPGNNDGPFQGTCDNWHFTYDDFCKRDSSLAFSTKTRIIIACFVAFISVATLVFWLFVFPCIFKGEPGDVENI
ncbi:hypothetical protein M9Y10_017350 [Tritrichomonas musculus]|uniref:Plexin repeat family protein n=1 Tax=Tritrichomonas musculus TaxID=1915356 RepID=A0ABR2HTI9_9EUKA